MNSVLVHPSGTLRISMVVAIFSNTSPSPVVNSLAQLVSSAVACSWADRGWLAEATSGTDFLNSRVPVHAMEKVCPSDDAVPDLLFVIPRFSPNLPTEGPKPGQESGKQSEVDFGMP